MSTRQVITKTVLVAVLVALGLTLAIAGNLPAMAQDDDLLLEEPKPTAKAPTQKPKPPAAAVGRADPLAAYWEAQWGVLNNHVAWAKGPPIVPGTMRYKPVLLKGGIPDAPYRPGEVDPGKVFLDNHCLIWETDRDAIDVLLRRTRALAEGLRRQFGLNLAAEALIDGQRQTGFSQLCLTNADVLRIVTERVLAAIRKDPAAKLFSVSQNDWDGHCLCERCREVEQREESPAGTLIHFVNQVAERVEREFPHVWIETLAYQYTHKPPTTIRPRHNVVPRLCTIECDFSQPLDKSSYPQNVRFVQDIKGWSAITDKLYVWDYTTNFHNFVGPHPNFPAMPGNIRGEMRRLACSSLE